MSTIRERLDAIYTPLEEAVALLHARRASLDSSFVVRPLGRSEEMQNTRPKRRTTNDESPQSRSADGLEQRLTTKTFAILFRAIATPNFELSHFIAQAKLQFLIPLVLEHYCDKLVMSNNPAKHALAKVKFHGATQTSPVTVLNMSILNGHRISEIKTLGGESLIEFHHGLLSQIKEMHHVEYVDASLWLMDHGPSAREYYADFLELFVDRAILFETFLLTAHDAPFTTEIVLPAFESVCARTGKRPLICRLDPPDREGDPYWLQYPMNLMPFVKEKLKAVEQK